MIAFMCLCGIIQTNIGLRKKTTWIVIVLMITTLIFRAYYILMLMFFITIHSYQFLLKPKSRLGKLSIVAVIFCIYLLFLTILRRFDPDIYKQFYYLRSIGRIDKYNTAIKPILSIIGSSDILLAVDSMIIMLRMMFPIELLFIKNSVSLFSNLLIVVYQIIVSFVIIKNTLMWSKISDNKKITLECFYAFLIMSAIFEPDFGSWMRHESVMLPIMLILADISQRRVSFRIGRISSHFNARRKMM